MTPASEPKFFNKYLPRLEHTLKHYLRQKHAETSQLHSAMNYAVFNGGKRTRPLLIYTAGHLLGGSLAALDKAAAAVELIHCYSLVHDDLPAMDDAELRRGKLSCHKAYDEATAILVGDALQSLAFEVVADISESELSPSKSLALIKTLAQSIGLEGMVGGQMMDIGNSKTLSQESLELLHHLKTGKLISACIELAILSSNTESRKIELQLREATKQLGLAFQMQDDVLDVLSTTEILGKSQGKDNSQTKTTFATIMPLEDAQRLTDTLFSKIDTELELCGENAMELRQLVRWIAQRTH